jgi:NAD+ synthase
LWIGQTDEQEMGFSYAEADQVLEQLIDQKKSATEIQIEGIAAETVQKVVAQVHAMCFKREVPYVL